MLLDNIFFCPSAFITSRRRFAKDTRLAYSANIVVFLQYIVKDIINRWLVL